MFSVYHFIWLGISMALIGLCLWQLKTRKPALKKVLTVACIGAAISELVKTFSMLHMIPSSDGSQMHLYMEMQHLPLHLCSIQLLLIFYVRFASESKMRETILAFMYPTCTIGAFLALLLPSIFPESIQVTQAFTHPLGYQFFLYHAMLVILGLYIPISGEIALHWKHYYSTMGILAAMAIVSIYLNSMFAVPHYVDGELVSVDYSTNFFFTQRTPIGIPLIEKWHWYVYLAVIIMLAVVLIGLFFLPFRNKNRKEETV